MIEEDFIPPRSLVALGDAIEALAQRTSEDTDIAVAVVAIITTDGFVEFRSPYGLEIVKVAMREACLALEE